MASPARVSFRVPPEAAGDRIDRVLAAQIPELSRRQARQLLDLGGVYVDGARTRRASLAVAPGQKIEANIGRALLDGAQEVTQLPADSIAFEDEHLVVVDKPSGLFAAPTRESDRNSVTRLLAKMGRTVKVVHRIDREASGLVIYAKTRAAAGGLSAAIREHRIEREYLVAVAAPGPGDDGVIDFALDDKESRTRYALANTVDSTVDSGRRGRITLLRCWLETGRTHQIRRHLAMVDFPVLGDRRYGRRTADDPPRLALHAHRLLFAHPLARRRIELTSPLPSDLTAWLG